MAGERYFQLRRVATAGSPARIVADGTVFPGPSRISFPDAWLDLPAGWVRIVWRGDHRSVALWPSLNAAVAVNCGVGDTDVVWVGQPDLEHLHPAMTALAEPDPPLYDQGGWMPRGAASVRLPLGAPSVRLDTINPYFQAT